MNGIIEWLLGPDAERFSGVANWRIGFVADYADDRLVCAGLAAMFAVLTFLTIRSYRREGTVRPLVKGTLAGIRIVVIALIIILILQPGIIIHEKQTLRSYLVVLIDDSLSMSFSDRYTGEQADSLRELLFLGGAEGPRGSEPADEGPAGAGPEAAAASRPAAAKATVLLDEMSRKDIVRRLLARKGGPLARLAREHPLIIMRFSTAHAGAKEKAGDYTRELGTTSVPEDAKDDEEPPQPPPGLAEALNSLTASGHVTDIGQAVYDALSHVQGRRLTGLVVISDGQITGKSKRETDRLEGAKRLAQERGVPLFTICVGDPTPPKRLSVISLRGPDRVRPGSPIEFTVSITHRGFAGKSVKVRLLRRPADKDRWTETGVSETVELKGTRKADGSEADKGTERVALKISPEDSEKMALGRFIFKAVVNPQEGELDPDDNSAEAPPVTVTDKRVHILLVSGDAGWEFQYLRNTLHRVPDMYRLSVWQQNADKEINQVASTGMKLDRLPETLTKLIGVGGDNPQPGYDLVILYDPKPGVEGFDGKFVENLKTYVQTHGKGLCYIAGNKYTDHLLRNDEISKPLRKMLPVRVSANTFNAVARIESRRPEPWPVRLTEDGLDHQLTRLGNSSEKTRQLWDLLPGMFWTHPVAKAKPAARVLLENTNPSRRTIDNQPEPVLATHAYGKGRVVYIGFDATWRWRCVDDGYYYRRFWGNIVEYMAVASARNMVITTGGNRFTADKRITVEVEAYDPENDYEPLEAEKLSLLMDPADSSEPTIELELEPVHGKPGHFRLTIDAPPVGIYDLMPKKDLGPGAGDGESGKVIKRITIEPPQAEREHRQSDPATMESLASMRQNFLPIHEIDNLADLVPPPRYPPKVRRIPKALWDCRLSLLLIVVLLSVEWVFRKKFNMA